MSRISRAAAWRARPLLWGVPLAIVAIALGLFVFYRVAYAGEVEALQGRYATETATLQTLIAQRREFESHLQRVSSSSEGVSELYLDHFSTEAERFTATIAEIRRLARAASLDPTSFSYPTVDLGELELRRVAASFNVEGTYDQLRRFINLLELSDHFLILEQVTANQGANSNEANPRLAINLTVSTIFASEELARRTAQEARQAALRARLQRDDAPSTGDARDAGDAGDVDVVDPGDEDLDR